MIEWQPFSYRQFDYITRSTARINVADGPVRSGKTVAQGVRWLAYLHDGPPGKLLISGKTKHTIRRNVLDLLADTVGNRRFRYNSSDGVLRLCGRECHVVGANDEKSEHKIRGATFAGWLADEVTLYPESFVRMALSRLSVPGAQAFWTCNPDSPYHFVHADFLTNEKLLAEGILRRFQFQLSDNLALPEEFRRDLAAMYSGLWYKRYVLGEWTLAEGVIYDMFSDQEHVVDDLPETERHWVAIDYGTSNPFVALLVGESEGRWYICREWYFDSAKMGRQMTDSEYSRALKAWLGDLALAGILVDPSAASFIAQMRRDGHRGVRLADNEVSDGIRSVANLLSHGLLMVHRSCTATLRSFSSYIWDPKAQARGEDRPLKQNDHCMDALRYAVQTLRLAPGRRKEKLSDPWHPTSPRTGV